MHPIDFQTPVQIGLIALAVVSLVAALYGATGMRGTRRYALSLGGLGVMLLSLILVAVSVPIFNSMRVKDVGASSREASMIATYADVLRAPKTPAEADQVFAVAIDDARSHDNVVITYHRVGDYQYEVIAANNHGTNTAPVCVTYNLDYKIWMPSTAACHR